MSDIPGVKIKKRVKIIQFQAMPDDEYYQGITIGLGDDGVMYVNNGQEWDVYHALKFKQQ